jgi:phenylacetaldehyde dehydrogenase
MATALKIHPREDKVQSFISRTHKMLINGKWVEALSGQTFATYNPATGEVLAHVAEGNHEDIDRAVKAARSAFETGRWSQLTPSERGRTGIPRQRKTFKNRPRSRCPPSRRPPEVHGWVGHED